jgi:hypothetical protein
MLCAMEAVFQLASPHQALPVSLTRCLDQWGLSAQPLDPSDHQGALAGWYRLESDRGSDLQAAVTALQQRSDVDAAYVKPDEGPPG